MFAWLTEPGIYFGRLVFGNQGPSDSVADNAQLLPYPDANGSSSAESEAPVSIAMTEFHFIMLYRDRVKAVGTMTQDLVYQEEIPLVNF